MFQISNAISESRKYLIECKFKSEAYTPMQAFQPSKYANNIFRNIDLSLTQEEYNDAFVLTGYFQSVNYFKEIQDEIRKNFNRDITEAGSGSFRTTYMVDNDYVIKVDSSMNGSGKQMNKEDGEVGRNPKYSSIFPKALGVAPDGSWVVLQKVHEIQDLMTLIALFPNKIIPPKIFGKFYTQSLLSIALSYQIATLQYDQNQMDFHKYEYESMFKDYLVKDIGRDVHEAVRPYNSGYVVEENGEKRFVILDSSVQKTVEAGLKAFNKPTRTI